MAEIMVPLVATVEEVTHCRRIIEDTAAEVAAETGVTVDYIIGTMIELPRACLIANEIAEEAHFFSFGTNDLTQTSLGISRDDAASSCVSMPMPAFIQSTRLYRWIKKVLAR